MPTIRTRDYNGRIDEIYPTIAKAAVNGKFLDFRDNLTLAYLDDYANIHGIGGAEHASSSGIKLLIQDYSAAAKKKYNKASVSCDAIIPCWLIDKLMDVVKANIAAPVYEDERKKPDEKAFVFNGLSFTSEMVQRSNRNISWILHSVLHALGETVKGSTRGLTVELGNALKKTRNAIQHDSTPFNAFPSNTPYMDYHYRQQHVYADKKTYDSLSPKEKETFRATVTSLEIKRNQFRDNGTLAQLPWTISIYKFKAPARWKDGNKPSYDRNATRQDECSLFVNISDNQMRECCYKTQHYILLWEMAYGIPLLRQGAAVYEAKMAENKSNSYNT